MTEPCKPCEEKRKEFNEAFSQMDFIKAAKVAMEGVKMMVKGVKDNTSGN